MFTAIQNLLWKKTAQLFQSELDVIAAILPLDDPRTKMLIQQALNPPWIERRKLHDSSFMVSIPYVKDSRDLIECSRDVESPALLVSDADSGREVVFTLRITRGGFLGPLTGRMLDSKPFPKRTNFGAIRRLERNWLPIASTRSQEELGLALLLEWVNMRVLPEVLALITVRPRATEAEIADIQRRLNMRLPPEYIEFLQISNGLKIGELKLGGTNELLLTDVAGESIVVISYLSPDAVLFFRKSSPGSSVFLASPDSPKGRQYAEGAKDLVRKLLAEAAVTPADSVTT